jgi:hypothetical protein
VFSSPLLGAAALLMTLGAQAATLGITGDWFQTIGSGDLIGGAGTDLRSPIESSASQGLVNIGDTNGEPWTLVVQDSGETLPSGVTLAVRRTGSGSCGGLAGGLQYQTLDGSVLAFFSGTGDCSGIGLQLQIQGLSISQGPGVHGTSLLYWLQ